jgi:hypothetical protein
MTPKSFLLPWLLHFPEPRGQLHLGFYFLSLKFNVLKAELSSTTQILSYLFIYFVVLKFELRAFTQFFVIGFFEIGSHELFAHAGFKL